MAATSSTWAALGRVPGLTAGALEAALAVLGCDVDALPGLPAARLRAAGLRPGIAARLAQLDRDAVAADLALCRRLGLRLVGWRAADYPPQLAAIPDAPAVLYVRGEPAVLRGPQLAVVGSRDPTAGGVRTAATFAAALAQAGLGITSGLARGIDAAAHQGALAGGGTTIAVCGTGLDRPYPAEHAALAARIVARGGALVSEFPPGTPPLARHFPQRNRLISGLSRGVLVVEAAERSGSLVTARTALDQGREVFAVPGSIHSPVAAGCLRLLRGGAHLAICPADVLREVGIALESTFPDQRVTGEPPPVRERRRLDKPAQMLLDAVGFEPVGIDELVERTGLAPAAIAAMLLVLELDGQVESLAGGRFCRITA